MAQEMTAKPTEADALLMLHNITCDILSYPVKKDDDGVPVFLDREDYNSVRLKAILSRCSELVAGPSVVREQVELEEAGPIEEVDEETAAAGKKAKLRGGKAGEKRAKQGEKQAKPGEKQQHQAGFTEGIISHLRSLLLSGSKKICRSLFLDASKLAPEQRRFKYATVYQPSFSMIMSLGQAEVPDLMARTGPMTISMFGQLAMAAMYDEVRHSSMLRRAAAALV
jgi:hypothetical protein